MSKKFNKQATKNVDKALVRIGVIKKKQIYAHTGCIVNRVRGYLDENGSPIINLSEFDKLVRKSIPKAIKDTEKFFNDILDEIKEEEIQ